MKTKGRKAIAKDGELMKTRPVRMTDLEWAKCKALGGAAFIRSKIKSAKVGHNAKMTVENMANSGLLSELDE